jgi:tetratricopeptide (TPR) repeat protein
MRVNSKWLVVLLLLLVALPLSGCGFYDRLQARDLLNKGVKAFTEKKYDPASQYFEKAIGLDPDLEDARVYLATAYMSQFVPGSTDQKSEQMAMKAIDVFKSVVDRAKDPANLNGNQKNAMLAAAGLFYQLKRSNDSKDWCNRILKSDPNNAEAYYRIAVVDYDDVVEKTGIQGENVGYLSPEENAATRSKVEEGLTVLSKALEIRPNYPDALQYQNLLYREKAKFEKDEKLKAELIHQADLISQKAVALELKAKEEAAKAPKKLGNIGKSR